MTPLKFNFRLKFEHQPKRPVEMDRKSRITPITRHKKFHADTGRQILYMKLNRNSNRYVFLSGGGNRFAREGRCPSRSTCLRTGRSWSTCPWRTWLTERSCGCSTVSPNSGAFSGNRLAVARSQVIHVDRFQLYS